MKASTPFEMELGDPSQYCDSACQDCPVLDQCGIGRTLMRRREAYESCGEDPDAIEAVVAEVGQDLERSMMLLVAECERRGIDVDALEPLPTPPLARRTEVLGSALVEAAAALAGSAAHGGHRDRSAGARLMGDATLLAVKAARAAWELSDPGPPGIGDTTEAVLLLVERTAAQVKQTARQLAAFAAPPVAARFDQALGALLELVGPWIAAVAEELRAELESRIRAGRAPSPFCRRPPRPELRLVRLD